MPGDYRFTAGAEGTGGLPRTKPKGQSVYADVQKAAGDQAEQDSDHDQRSAVRNQGHSGTNQAYVVPGALGKIQRLSARVLRAASSQ